MFQENKICLGHCLAFLWPWLQKPTVKFFSILKCTGNRGSLNSFPEDSAAAAAKLLQSCPTLCDPRRQPTSLPRPWDSPGKNTGVGCHFLLQCIKVKSETEVAQLCLTLGDPMDCSLPGSSVHGIFQARLLEWVAFSELQAQ